ncbi:TonB-dependent receptor [Ohtaekwangia koreensis]|uniref:Iron complex outermembrane recepter protein n=1 Tax=Ohtaekwangia koreensis TaxID=688867 RepID=A0A1T5MH76_9BACT|nr:TonB-dependent receptor [Ohtaekwangia koreensis]SKC87552.1 iron complex outermembrane recepter protein [Ohtaekwangia koreensis]
MPLFTRFPAILVFILASATAFAQSGSIKGVVKTSDGQAAPFVNVALKEINKGTTTSEDGSFVLKNIKAGSYTLITSFVGFQPQEKQIDIAAGEVTVVDFTLSENSEQLQEIVISDSRSLNEKTVEIGKAGIKPMDLPQSLIVIDKTVLENQQAGRLSDVLVNTSGIYLMGATGGVQEEIAGRGFSYGSNNTFKNGVRFNNGVMPEISSLERVEVLKGSAAILFGNVTAGGVLNLVTKKPKFQDGGELSFRTGSYDFYKPSLDIYGSVNNSSKVAYRMNTSYENARSFRDNVTSERIYFNPSFIIKAGKKTEILVEGDYLKDNRTLDYGTGAVNYEIADVPRSRFLGASWSYYKAEQKSATITINHALNDNWTLNVLGSYQGFYNDQYGTTRPNASSQFVRTDGRWVRGLQRSGTDQDYYIVQANLTGKFSTGSIKHQVLFGADNDKYENTAQAYAYENPAITGNNKNVYDTINVYNLSLYQQRTDIPTMRLTSTTENPSQRVGVYVQDLISILENVKLLAGIRYSYMESGTDKTKTYDDAFSPRLGIVYQPLKEMSVFASYANSFTLNTGLDVNNERLAPSVIDQYEVGIKNEFLKGFLSANITAYQIVNSNLAQSVLPIPDDAINKSNPQELAGEVTSKGVELDVMSKPINGISIIAGYSYNDTRYTESSQYINNSRLRYNPSHTANASVYYTFSNSFLKNFNVGFTTFYIGERVAGRSTRTTVANDTYKLMAIPNYFLFDLSAGYSFDQISVRAKVSNLLNELSYNVHDDNSVNPIAPRMFTATLSYKW